MIGKLKGLIDSYGEDFVILDVGGVGYQVQVQVPIQRMNSIDQIRNIPVAQAQGDQVSLRNVASVAPGTVLGQYDRYNMQRMVTVGANVAGEDLGRVADRVADAVKRAGEPPKGVSVAVRGQVTAMAELFGAFQDMVRRRAAA